MDTLTSIKLFREVVDTGTFVAAADRLGVSTAMASKHIAHLERELGVRLLNRTSRHLSLTEAGKVYYEQCREALDILQAAESAVGLQAETPRGVLKVTAPVWSANQFFADILVAYQRKYPQVLVEMHLENRRVDLVEEGFDLALRATSADLSSTLIVRPLCKVPFVLVGAPRYLDEHGRPATPSDIEQHQLILPTYVNMEQMEVDGPQGKVKLRHKAVFKTGDTNLTLQVVRAGMGLAYMPAWLAAEDLQAGTIEQVLAEQSFFTPKPTLYAVYTSRKYMATKVRTFIDFLSEAFVG
jgi:DNA-binding transcriptional LysR family regulator